DWQSLLGPGIFETNFAQNSNLENNYPYASQTSEYLFESGTPYITDVRALEDGSYGLSDTVTLVVSFSEAVNVDTTSTTPSFDLNFSGTPVSVPYYSGSGNSTLTFLYEISSQDENSNDLEYPDDTTMTAGSNITAVSDSDPIDETFPRKGFGNSLGEMSKVIVDAVEPTVTLDDSDTDNNVSTSSSVVVTATFSEAMQTTPTISLLNGTITNQEMTATSSSAIWIYDLSFSGLSDGSYTATFSGEDLAGNAFTGTDSITFIIDTTTPTVTLSCSDSDLTVGSETVTITATFNENISSSPTPTIYIRGSGSYELTATSSTVWYYLWDTSSESTGSYTATVSAEDIVGNSYAGDDSIIINVDLTSPTIISFEDSDADDVLTGSETVSFTAVFSEALDSDPTISISGLVTNSLFSKENVLRQIGSDIVGDNNGDNFGSSIASNKEGTRIIIGAPKKANGSNVQAGSVKVYETSTVSGGWSLVGSEFLGVAADDHQGFEVAMTRDGNRIAFSIGKNRYVKFTPLSTTEKGRVEVYDWNGTSWVQVGNTLEGAAVQDQFGHSIAFNEDGSKIYIGSPFNDDGASDAGKVQSYQYSSTISDWVAEGTAIDGTGTSGLLGLSLDVDKDGSTLAVGAPKYNNEGRVSIYNWNGSNWSASRTWDGDTAGDEFGHKVVLDEDGNTLVVGIQGHFFDTGKIQAYSYSGSSWSTKGSAIVGEATSDRFGSKVDLSDDGNNVIVGAYNHGPNQAGQVKVYDWGGSSWSQFDQTIDGQQPQKWGYDVAISHDAEKVFLGLGNTTIPGSVKAYSKGHWQFDWDVDSLGTPVDGEYTATLNATDTVGNVYTGTDSITFKVDNTPPTVVLTDTDDDNLLSGSSLVTITATFSEEINTLPSPVILLNGPTDLQFTLTQTNTNTYYFLWDTSLVGPDPNYVPPPPPAVPSPTIISFFPEGSYTVTVTGYDLAGNSNAGTVSLSFDIDTTSPTLVLEQSDADGIVKNTDTVVVTATFSEAMQATPTLYMGSLITNQEMTATASSAVWIHSIDLGGLSVTDGSYQVTVTGSDLVGN
ncbi:MAG: Ig-like domain-containing protein, partial [Flavobacteriaceae bacterium]